MLYYTVLSYTKYIHITYIHTTPTSIYYYYTIILLLLYYAVLGKTDGSHPFTTIGFMQLASYPDLCVARTLEYQATDLSMVSMIYTIFVYVYVYVCIFIMYILPYAALYY